MGVLWRLVHQELRPGASSTEMARSSSNLTGGSGNRGLSQETIDKIVGVAATDEDKRIMAAMAIHSGKAMRSVGRTSGVS